MLPELIVIATAFAVLSADLWLTERARRILAPLAMAGLAAGLLALVAAAPMGGTMLGGRFALDPPAWWFKLIFMLAGGVTVLLSMDLLDGRARVRVRGMGFRGEYYAMLLFSVSGMMYLISARDLVMLYVSLELATVPLYALAAWRRDDARSGEAGLKYVVVGALASAFILYGLGLLFGLTGQTDLAAISRLLEPSPAFWLAAAAVVAGIGFKLTLVPFHMWAPDVYQGAPTPITAYLSVASKAAGLAFIFQLFFRVMGGYLHQWALVVAVLAALTMTVGNVVAILQHNIKRFMAYSAISQAGYLVMGFLGPFGEGVAAMLFYMLVYIVTNLAVFACIVWYSNETGREQIEEYRGLARTNPLIALAMMVSLFSLAGIPPLSGFVGKFFLFSVASQAGFHWLVALAAVNSTISLYYYLRVVRQMYIEPVFEGASRLPIGRPLAVGLAALALGAVLLGIIPFLYEHVHATTASWLATLAQ
jgi:NADH-quinone oxidoreductase subunit N